MVVFPASPAPPPPSLPPLLSSDTNSKHLCPAQSSSSKSPLSKRPEHKSTLRACTCVRSPRSAEMSIVLILGFLPIHALCWPSGSFFVSLAHSQRAESSSIVAVLSPHSAKRGYSGTARVRAAAFKQCSSWKCQVSWQTMAASFDDPIFLLFNIVLNEKLDFDSELITQPFSDSDHSVSVLAHIYQYLNIYWSIFLTGFGMTSYHWYQYLNLCFAPDKLFQLMFTVDCLSSWRFTEPVSKPLRLWPKFALIAKKKPKQNIYRIWRYSLNIYIDLTLQFALHYSVSMLFLHYESFRKQVQEDTGEFLFFSSVIQILQYCRS